MAAEAMLRLQGPPLSWARPPAVVGLAYHGVVQDRAEALSYYDPHLLTSTAFFDLQMELVSRWLRPTAAGDVRLSDACQAVVGFDDAFTIILRNAIPTLHRWRIPATTYVNDATTDGACLWHDVIGSACPSPTAAYHRVRELKGASVRQVEEAVAACGGRQRGPLDRYMSWDELRKWRAEGMEVGGHTTTHYILTYVDDETREQEVRGNRSAIARNLGVVPATFAYPNGDHDGPTRQAIKDAGYEFAYEVEGTGDGTDPLSLPRRNICDAMCTDEDGYFSPALFLAEITGMVPKPTRSAS